MNDTGDEDVYMSPMRFVYASVVTRLTGVNHPVPVIYPLDRQRPPSEEERGHVLDETVHEVLLQGA